MATFKRFEEMHAWQSARDLVKLIYDTTNLARSKNQKMVREGTGQYILDLPDDLS